MKNFFTLKHSKLEQKIIKTSFIKKSYNDFLKEEDQIFLKNNIIKKPWGFEYLFYSTKKFALWILCIKKNQSTSLHCHIKKKTYLINKDKFFLKTFNKKLKINKFAILSIDKMAFHKSINYNKNYLTIFEFEIPNIKHDIFRFSDDYNRPSINYEKAKEKSIFSKKFKKNNLKNVLIFNFRLLKKNKFLRNGIYFLFNGKLKINGKSIKKYTPVKLKFTKEKKSKFYASKDIKIIIILNHDE